MSERQSFMRYLPALLIAVAGTAMSVAGAHYQERDNREVLQRRIERILGAAAAGIDTRLRDYRNVLRGVRGLLLVEGPDRTGQAQLGRYIANIDVVHEFPGARGFGFIRRVRPAEQAAFLQRQRDGHDGRFELHGFGPNDGERFVIQLIEPIDGNRAALGLDIASEPSRRSAALAAMRSGAGQLTAPITLVQATGSKGQAFLFLLPVYDQGVIPAPAEREAHLVGWTYTPLQVDAILRDLIDPREQVSFGLEDVTDAQHAVVLPVARAASTVVQARTEITVFGRRWRLVLSGGEEFAAQHHLTRPATVLALGLGATAALTALALLAAAGRRRRLEAQGEQAKLAAIVDSSIDAIIGKELDGRVTSWNRGAEALFGYTAHEAIGRTVAELVVPAERLDEESTVLAQVAAGGAMADLETRRRHKDGHLIDVWIAISPVLAPDGSVRSVATTVRDITERKAAEERARAANARLEETVASRTAQLQQLNALLRGVLDAATGAAIVATAPDGRITVFNRGAELMLGYRAADVVGKTTPVVFHDPAEVAARAAEISEAEGIPVDGMRTFVTYAERDGAETREWCYLRRDGSRIAVSLTVSAIRDDAGRIDGYLGVAVDITARTELLDSLRRAKLEADAASEAKSSFLANMSHEIRTPMNAVLGMLQLLQMTGLDHRQQDYAGKAEQAARALLQLLNDVLDFSKIEAGKLKLDPHPFEVDGLMRDLAVVLSGNQGDKAVEVLFDMDPRLPPCLVGDRQRLQQVLINLGGNALKFTERGSVKVGIELLDRDGDKVRVRVVVQDTGIGIGPAQRERIFDGFTQAEASISRRFGGTGLGLVICRRLVSLMGGCLELDSTLGVGSRFWFDLRLQVGPPAQRTQTKGLRVLVVDDHAAAAEALVRMVDGLGWDAMLARSGAEALALVRGAAQPFDAVLLDWRMPGIDGLDTARSIRDSCDRPPVVVMVTAFGREMLLAEHEAGDASPFADVLTKPVTPRLIDEAVRRALSGQAAPTSAPAAPRRRRLAGMRILLVEDNAMNRQVARELLEGEGAQVAVAEDGAQGVQYLLAAQTLPDAVLMDMQMPVMDGLEATRRIRAALGPGLRIVAMTANVSHADQARCLEAGMDEHLGKPIDLEALVRTLLPAAGAPPAAALAGDAAAPAGPAAEEPVQSLLARFGGNAGLYLRSLDTFQPEAEALLAQARSALGRGDHASAAAGIHGLKGMAGTVGARALAAQMAELEHLLKTLADGVSCLAMLEAVTPEALQAVCTRLRRAAEPFQEDTPAAEAPAPLQAAEMDELQGLLASGNLRALDIAERLAAQAAPDSPQAVLAAQIQRLDFEAAGVTLAQLAQAADAPS